MTLLPKDRRGLGETMSVVTLLLVFGAIAIVILMNHPGAELPPWLVGILTGGASAVGILGIKGAGERSASSEIRNAEAAELRLARERLDEATHRLESMSNRILDKQIELYLPAPPRPGDKS
jgi:hypothetical protein